MSDDYNPDQGCDLPFCPVCGKEDCECPPENEAKLVTSIISGENAHEILDSLETALKPFGLYLTAHPTFEGSSDYGYIISNRPLTETELADEVADLEGDDLGADDDSAGFGTGFEK